MDHGNAFNVLSNSSSKWTEGWYTIEASNARWSLDWFGLGLAFPSNLRTVMMYLIVQEELHYHWRYPNKWRYWQHWRWRDIGNAFQTSVPEHHQLSKAQWYKISVMLREEFEHLCHGYQGCLSPDKKMGNTNNKMTRSCSIQQAQRTGSPWRKECSFNGIASSILQISLFHVLDVMLVMYIFLSKPKSLLTQQQWFLDHNHDNRQNSVVSTGCCAFTMDFGQDHMRCQISSCHGLPCTITSFC